VINVFKSSLTLTAKDLYGIIYYLTSKEPDYDECLDIIKALKAKVYVRNRYYIVTDTLEVWDYIVRNFSSVLNKRKLTSIEEVINNAADWCSRYGIGLT